MSPCQPPGGPTRTPSGDDVLTSPLPRPPAVSVDEVRTSVLPHPPTAPVHDVMTSTALPRPLAMPVDHAMTSAVPHPPTVPRDDAVTSALSDRESVLIDLPFRNYIVQYSSDNVSFLDSTKTIMSQRTDQLLPAFAARIGAATEQSLPDLSRPSHLGRQLLLPGSTNTLFGSTVPCLPAIQPTVHDYQNISALSLPAVSTLANAPTYVGAPLSYTEDSQRVPIAVEHAGLSAFHV